VYHYKGFHGCASKCGLRILRLTDRRVAVICSELPDNPGTSVTNFAEDLAGLVCAQHGINPEHLVWIEHYPPDNPRHGLRRGRASWDLVTFKVLLHDGRTCVFDEPQWRPMNEGHWRALGLPVPT
jgi:hypothetical protein